MVRLVLSLALFLLLLLLLQELVVVEDCGNDGFPKMNGEEVHVEEQETLLMKGEVTKAVVNGEVEGKDAAEAATSLITYLESSPTLKSLNSFIMLQSQLGLPDFGYV